MNTPTRTSRRALLALALAATCAATAVRADDWTVRPVRLGTSTSSAANIDVLLRGNDVSVGYTLPSDPTLYLSTLPAGQPYFQHLSGGHPLLAASFAADAVGNFYFAGRINSSIRVGTDTAGWGLGLVDNLHPNSSLGIRTPLPAVAVDSNGIPAFVASNPSGQRVFSRFDVPSGTWQDQTLPSSTTSFFGFVQSALAYTPDDRAVVAYVNTSASQTPLVVSVQTDQFSWLNFNPATFANPTRGVSVAAASDGRIGVAFVTSDGLHVATFDGTTWTDDRLSTLPANLIPHSLTVDATGQFALAYAPNLSTTTPAPLHLASHTANGTWSDQTLPLSAINASVTFDAANHPFVGAFDGTNALLAGKTISSLLANDFTLDGAVSADDVPAFAQAIRHPSTYLAAHTPLTTADLVAIGNHDTDVRLTDSDARSFVESLTAHPVPGLPTRAAGYLAFDQADLNPINGSGTGNFFSTTLSTNKPYTPGDSRGDLTGSTPGSPDGRIDVSDVNYLQAALFPSTTTDPRLDLNQDGVADAADFHDLVHTILGTTEGDANVDGVINADDFSLVDRGFAMHLTGWSNGDFNNDGTVNSADYLLLDSAFGQAQGLSPAFLAQRASQFGADYVQQLLTSIPEPSAPLAACGLAFLLPLTRRRHTL